MTSKWSAGAMLPVVRRFFLGPWPIHAGALWTFLALALTGVSWRIVGPRPILPTSAPLSQRVLMVLLIGLLMPSLVVAPLVVYRRLRARFTDRAMGSAEYMLSLAGASLISGVLINRAFQFSTEYQQVMSYPSPLDGAWRAFFPTWILIAVIGSVFARIQKESDTAQDALQTVVAQRRLLLESEERVRSQVAAYLHDRVQTDLVSIALRVRAIIGLTPEVMTSELNSVITELERVRSQEVRRASRQLSPNLEHVSLEESLRDLSTTYWPAMVVTVSVSESAARELKLRDQVTRATAIYRICDQGLLNSAIHGHATECSIHMWLNAENELVLELHDNGVGLLPTPAEPGMGFTVISAWVESLSGKWSLAAVPTGIKLTASLPAHTKNVD